MQCIKRCVAIINASTSRKHERTPRQNTQGWQSVRDKKAVEIAEYMRKDGDQSIYVLPRSYNSWLLAREATSRATGSRARSAWDEISKESCINNLRDPQDFFFQVIEYCVLCKCDMIFSLRDAVTW